jgi:hypothetical protein
MKATCISIPELALIAGTRAALGAGIALILGERLTKYQKKAVGWTLFLVGVVTTVPILADVIGKRVNV